MLLTPTQTETLRAAMNRIIPPDDVWPGAWEAGCGDFLLGMFGRELAPLLDDYRAGLDALDAESGKNYAAPFTDLRPEAQDALLRRVEAGDVLAAWPVPAPLFFRRLVHHTHEGFYADPGNGGNRNAVSWRMTGFRK